MVHGLNVKLLCWCGLSSSFFACLCPLPAGPLLRGLVSCTGAQFCGVALIETKNRALAVVRQLEQELDIPSAVRMHWTGCPNSCAQAQVGDIGLMGAPARVDGKAVEGVRIMLGGVIGENPRVSFMCYQKRLRQLIVHFCAGNDARAHRLHAARHRL